MSLITVGVFWAASATTTTIAENQKIHLLVQQIIMNGVTLWMPIQGGSTARMFQIVLRVSFN